jgi:hypothetical protein
MFKSILILFMTLIGMSNTSNLLAQEEMSVLFIGNSYTFMNDMPFTFKNMAANAGHNVHVDIVVEGGKNMQYHSEQILTYDKISSRKWNYVVVQCHSNELAAPEDSIDKKTAPFAKKIIDAIRSNSSCTEVILYMTWGYKFGNNNWSPIATYETMQEKIRANYMRFGEMFDAKICPVGMVWKKLRNTNPTIDLYDPDLHHPSKIGSYISASTFFSVIFGESSVGNTELGGNAIEEATLVQDFASEMVLNNLSQWKLNYKDYDLKPGFDVKIKGCSIELKTTAIGAAEVNYSFGDGFSSLLNDPSHEFEQRGSYTITQTIKNSCRTRSFTKTVVIE